MKVPEPHKLPSGTWFLQMRLNGVSVPVSASTKKECIRRAELIKAEHRTKKRIISRSSMTLRQACEKYIDSRRNVVSPETVRGYSGIVNHRFQSVMDLPLTQTQNWQQICNDELLSCSPKTLKNAWGFIGSVMRSQNMLPPNITLPQVVPASRPWLSPEEIADFIVKTRGHACEVPLLIALHGLRRSEICALTWDNIDLNKNVMRVYGAVVYDEHNDVVQKATNKNVASHRTVPIMISALRDALIAVPVKSGTVINCSPKTLTYRLTRACEEIGFPGISPHCLRHSFASLAYHLGWSEMETMRIGGWSDAGTMRKIYTHLSENDLNSATKKMADFYNNANSNANSL